MSEDAAFALYPFHQLNTATETTEWALVTKISRLFWLVSNTDGQELEEEELQVRGHLRVEMVRSGK